MRNIGRVLITAVAAAALAACGGDDGGTAGTGGSIEFEVAGSPDEFRLYREVAEAFERKTGTDVEVREVPDEESFGIKLATSIAAGRAPDVALISYRGYKKYAEAGQLIPVGPKIGGLAADYYREPVDAFTYEGELQCLPQNLSSLVVYYNEELFEKAGLEPPAGDWTYDDLIRAAAKIQGTKTEDGEAFGVSIEKELIRLAPFVWSAGGEIVDDPADPTRLTLDTPEARRGVENYIRLAEYGPDADEAVEGEDALFVEGRLGMVIGSRKKVPTFRAARFAWNVAPFPKDREQVTVLHTDGFCMVKGADEKRALEFVKFAGGPEGQKILTELGRVVPSIRSLAQSPDFLRSTPPQDNQVFLDAEKHLRTLPTVPESPYIEQRTEEALKEAFFGRLTVEEAIERIEEETAPIFRGDVDEAELQREAEEEAEREAAGGEESEAEREAEEAEREREEREREAEGN